ncbi:Uncharacterised protein [Halioglobus japonicus]|nr:Uncharacterised protein [Halioglobus japonicus]
MSYFEYTRIYIRWMLGLILLAVSLWWIYKPLTLLILFLTLFLPMDRARIQMFKRGHQIPISDIAWKVVGTLLVYPTILALIVGFSMQVPEGKMRAHSVVSSMLVLLLPVFWVSCICFFSRSTWNRGLSKYAPETA